MMLRHFSLILHVKYVQCLTSGSRVQSIEGNRPVSQESTTTTDRLASLLRLRGCGRGATSTLSPPLSVVSARLDCGGKRI